MLRAALGAILAIVATPLWAQQLPQAPRPVQTSVALTLVLAVDASGSVSDDRFELQKQGYAAAFRNRQVLNSIRSLITQSIAITMTQWTGPERRLEPRHQRSEPVLVEYLDESMRLIHQEEAKMENLSESGVRVIVKSAPPDFDLVKIGDVDDSFKSMAAVRNRFVDTDGLERLCLKLIGNKWPV